MEKKKLSERISLSLRKKWTTSRSKTFLLAAIVIVLFLLLNFWVENTDLPKIDLTEEKMYTVSDQSKDLVKQINQDVKIYVFGYNEDDHVVGMVKQYCEANEKITYEFITTEDNVDKINLFGLKSGDQAIVIESGESNQIIFSYDFSSVDYSTYTTTDLTENKLTNTILNLTIAEKPVVYLLTGHNEYAADALGVALTYLENDIFEYKELNLLTTTSIPEDCSSILIMSPTSDLYEQEYNLLEGYINNGGNLLFTGDFLNEENPASMEYWSKLLGLYGVSIEKGFIYESDSGRTLAVSKESNEGSPYIFYPTIENSSVTSKIYNNSSIVMEYPQEIKIADTETLTSLGVTSENLLTSSEKSYYITNYADQSTWFNDEAKNHIIGAKLTKTITPVTESAEENTEEATEETAENSSEEKQSELIVIGNGQFCSSYFSTVLYYAAGQQISQANLADNVNFFITCVASLTDREDTIYIEKATDYTYFTPTTEESRIVLGIIFGVPVIIIVAGIVVWNYRKHKR